MRNAYDSDHNPPTRNNLAKSHPASQHQGIYKRSRGGGKGATNISDKQSCFERELRGENATSIYFYATTPYTVNVLCLYPLSYSVCCNRGDDTCGSRVGIFIVSLDGERGCDVQGARGYARGA